MRHLLTALILTACFAAASAQDAASLDKKQRNEYTAALRQAKHEYIARELQLTDEQQDAFFPLYDEMNEEVMRINVETRNLEKKVLNDEEASDTEIESAARTSFEQKAREGQVEASYFEKFKKTLTPQQLLRLKNAERKFTQQLVRKRGAKGRDK